ncbi:MAG: transposase [Saprospiraceae bacterium]|nr:transposase [Saprospiraceae bacterium]
MAITYTQFYVHVVFAGKGRANIISTTLKKKLYQYIKGIVKNKNQKIMMINGRPDHVHILVGLKPTQSTQYQLLMDRYCKNWKYPKDHHNFRSKHRR